jgi:hypothetical protein
VDKCGWCGEEIKDNQCFKLWNSSEGKLVLVWCKKCDDDEKLTEHIKGIFAKKP